MFGFNPLYAALFAAGLAGAPAPTPVYSLDFMTGVLPAGIDFARSSQATRIGPTGLLEFTDNRILLRTALAGGTSGTVGAGAVAPTGWVFINTGGTVTYLSSLYGSQTAIRFVTGSGQRPAIGQSVTCDANGVYVYSFRVEAVNSGTLTIDDVSVYGALPGGVTQVSYANGVAVASTYVLQAGDYIERSVAFGSTGASLQVRLGGGASGSGSVGDITLSSPQFERRLVAPARATPFVIVGTTAYYGPRFDYNPTTLLPNGILIEKAATNIAAFWRGALTYSGVIELSTTEPGADGATVARRIQENSSIVTGQFAQGTAAISFTANTVYTMTRLIKPGTATRCQITTNAALSTLGAYVNFSLVGEGSILATGPGAVGFIRKHANGYYACSMSFTASSTQTLSGLVVAMINSDTAGRIPTYQGTGLTLILDGHQIETGAFPTSIVPTFGATTTRVADALTTSSLGWLNPAAGTVVSEYMRPLLVAAQHVFSLSDAGSFNNIIYQAGGSGSPGQRRFDVTTGAVNQAQIQLTLTQTAGVVYKDAMRWAANNFAASENGGAVVTDVSGTVPTVNLLSLSTGQTLMYVRRFAYYNTALSDSELVTLSTV